jgi:RNA polymerase sigma-70 factor, ECF subfamily
MSLRENRAATLRLVENDGTPPQPVPAPARDDIELLAAMRANEVGAASAFHDRCRGQVDRTIVRLLGRRDVDHEDLSQLALIELVYSVDRFRGQCSLDSWIATITAHVVYKHLRRRATERRIFHMPADGEIPAAASRGVGREVILRSMIARIRGHLDAISPAKAWAFLLHDVCGYDLRETAKILDVSVAAAQQRLVRGRRELHEIIADDPELANWLKETEE